MISEFEIGFVLNKRYEIVDVLYKDDKKCVYKVKDKRLRDSILAIEEIDKEKIEEEKIKSLRHRGLPRVTDIFYLNEKSYLVMDLVEGETLESLTNKEDIDDSLVKDWINQINWLLKYLKAKDYSCIYENLSLDNVIITKDNEVKVVDLIGELNKNSVNILDELSKLINTTEEETTNEEVVEEIKKDEKTKKSKGKIIVPIIVILAIVLGIGGYFVFSNNNSNKNSNVIDKETNNVVNNSSKEHSVQKAIEVLYETTGADPEMTVYELNTSTTGSYVSEEQVKKDFYIFTESGAVTGDMADNNLLVHKKDLSVYICNPGTIIMPYKDYYNRSTTLGSYIDSYLENIYNEYSSLEYTEEYININGSLELYKKVEEILSSTDKYTVSHFGAATYVENILGGMTKEELDIQAYAYPNNEFGAIEIINKMLDTYPTAVAYGDPTMMYAYTTYDGNLVEVYDESIPRYYEEGITIELLNRDLKEIKIESENQLRVTYATKYKITNESGSKIQKEEADYIVMLSEYKEAAVDRLENWKIVD